MSLSSYFNNSGTGVIDLSSYFSNSTNNNQNQKPFQNQYYQDALKNPDNYTWGVWDANKPMSSDNWQPKPRQAGDARDPKSSSYQKPFSVSDSIKDNKSNGSINASNDNWTLPTYNYDPNLTFGFLNAVQSDSYNPQNQQYLRDNNALADEAGRQQANRQAAAQWQGVNMGNQQNWQNAQIEKYRNQPTSFSSSRTLDPNSKEGWDYQIWQNINTNNQIRAQQPALDTQKQVQQIASTGTVDAAKAQSQGYVESAKLQAGSNEKIAQIGATKDMSVAELKAAIDKQIAELSAKKDIDVAGMQTDVQKQIAQIARDQAISAANIAAQSQMYGANMGAMSSMFGSQMGAVGSMFGSMGGGGGARYW